MRKARYLLGLALLVAASLYLLPALRAADEPVLDSPEVTDLLVQAKGCAARLANIADEMHKSDVSSLSWRTYAEQLTLMKQEMKSIGSLLGQMNERYEWASPWQQDAIDRISNMAAGLASNIDTTIEHLNDNQERLSPGEFKNNLTSNYELSSSLSKVISNYVSYGNNKAKYDVLGTDLEMPQQ